MSSAEHNWVSVVTAAASLGPEVRAPTAGTGRRAESDVSRWLLTREALVNILLVSVMISVVWGSIAMHLTQQARQVEAQAKRETGNLAQAAAESIGQTIASVDDTLRFMRAIYLADPQRFDLSAWTNRVNETRGVALEFALIGRDGNLMANSLGPVGAPRNFADQDFFRSQAGDATDRLFISRPIAARVPGRWSVLFTRRITAADGWFTGIIVASADPSWLTRLHQSLDIGRGAVMLVGNDGRIRALAGGGDPGTMPGIGDRIEFAGVLDAPIHPDRGTLTWTGAVNEAPQIASFQRLADGDAYIVVSMDWRDILAPYRLYARQYRIFGSCITLLILIAGMLLLSNTRRLLVSRQVLHDAMNAISQGVVMIDASGRVPVINRRARELLRGPSGATGDALDIAALGQGDVQVNRAWDHVRPDGTTLEIRTHELTTGGVVRTYTDITERKDAEAQITHLALHDSLTGLPNRRMLADRLSAAIVREDGGGAVLLVDLDRFKNVNDRHGHSFGDRLLVQATLRMRGIAGEDDLVARIGGDEFCILQAAQGDLAAAEALAREIVRQLSEPYLIDGQEVLLGASVGIARYPHDGSSGDDILTRADTALYRAKQDGRATFRFYEAAMDVRIADQRLLEQDLRDALARGQLSVVYQPIFDSATCEVTGFEALLRWFHPTRGAISPDEFIPIAEACGVIVRLGEWILETACSEARAWPQPLSVAVNLSPKQFWQTDVADRVAAILAKTGLPAGRLALEVTEGVLIDNPLHTLTVMSTLKRRGIRLVLDDFGTGYSSLSYLRRFPFDGLKIDRSFIKTLSEDEDSRAIVRAILTLGQSLRMRVVAEGVETSDQLEWLRAESCGLVQGYLLGRPMPAAELADFLADAGAGLVDTLAARSAS